MQTWNYIDKKEWPRGEWDNEPDKAQWEHKGLDCLIVRNRAGALCGYVGVPQGHEWHGLDYDSSKIDVDVHGGLTYASPCDDGGKICHLDGVNSGVWWLGFDCAHYLDAYPTMDQEYWEGEYRNFDYLRRETEMLARQVAEAKSRIIRSTGKEELHD